MKAVVWEGKPFEMAVRDVPKARIEMPEDAIVRVTTSAICGSDLHTYHGVLGSSEVPWIQGHEAIGVVVEVGSATETFEVGDRVSVAAFADDGHFATEPSLQPSFTSFGFGKEFGVAGGCQAEYVRVPFADDSLVVSEIRNTADSDSPIAMVRLNNAKSQNSGSPTTRLTNWTTCSSPTFLLPAGSVWTSPASKPGIRWPYSAQGPSVSCVPTLLFYGVHRRST